MNSTSLTFAEKLITLLDEGAFNTTYKFAVLLALLDLAVELTSDDADPNRKLTAITTGRVAEKVLEIYWNQSTPFNKDKPLKAGMSGQAEILTEIVKFRNHSDHAGKSLRQVQNSPRFNALIAKIEWKLVELPLPRLQWFGNREDRFIYGIAWNKDVTRAEFQKPGFDRRILFKENVVDHLVTLNGLLRPLVQRKWTQFVAAANKDLVVDSQLEEFLFGSKRIALERVGQPLLEIQKGRCFYCSEGIRSKLQVDHFIPWSRWPSNLIENLVAAHGDCNGSKKDFFPASRHLKEWTLRNTRSADVLKDLGRRMTWETDGERAWSAARGIYLRLPESTQLWVAKGKFESLDQKVIHAQLS